MAYTYQQEGSFQRIAHDDSDGKTFTLATMQDMTDAIEENRALRENQTGKEEFRLVARVPIHVAEQAMREGWFHDDEAWKRWMNDGDNRDHRVWEGAI
jgi:hypothetical protein